MLQQEKASSKSEETGYNANKISDGHRKFVISLRIAFH